MLLRFSVSGFNQLTESSLFFFHLFAVFSSWILSVTGCCVHASLGNRVVSWACVLKLLGRSTSWLGVLPVTRPLSEQGGALPGTLQSDGALWMRRGLRFVDLLGHNSVSVNSVLLCFPLWLYMEFISFKPHLPYKRQCRGLCLGCGFPSPGRGACGRRQSTSLVLMFLPLSLLPPFYSL